MTLRDIIQEARKLSHDEKVDLIDELYCMINVDPDGTTLTAAQAADLDRRIDELESGKAKLIPGDEAVAMIRKRG
jgi:putative addiction module component (TIGR02574 family)